MQDSGMHSAWTQDLGQLGADPFMRRGKGVRWSEGRLFAMMHLPRKTEVLRCALGSTEACSCDKPRGMPWRKLATWSRQRMAVHPAGFSHGCQRPKHTLRLGTCQKGCCSHTIVISLLVKPPSVKTVDYMQLHPIKIVGPVLWVHLGRDPSVLSWFLLPHLPTDISTINPKTFS